MVRRRGVSDQWSVLVFLVASLAMFGHDAVWALGPGGGGGGAGVSRAGPAPRGPVAAPPVRQHDRARDPVNTRRETGREIREERREAAPDVRDPRREAVRDNLGDRREAGPGPGDRRPPGEGEGPDDRGDRLKKGAVVRHNRVGTALTVSAFRGLDCDVESVLVDSARYYRCEDAWYRRTRQSGQEMYEVVEPPSGYQ